MRIVIFVKGGEVTTVMADDETVKVYLIDQDIQGVPAKNIVGEGGNRAVPSRVDVVVAPVVVQMTLKHYHLL